jgi:23S rRNA pseudouridine1911/1915/1917 synthase
MSEEEFVVSKEEDGTRLDRFLAVRIPDISRSQLRKWLDEGRVTVDGAPAKPSLPLKPGFRIRLDRPAPIPSTLTPEAITIHVLHEDEEILVLNKPAGLTVHPGAGRRQGTLAHGLLHLYPDRSWPGPPERPGIVHRLDRLTSGLMVVACSGGAYLNLQGQISRRELHRGYIAICWGCPSSATGVIDAPIGRDLRDRKRMAVVRRGGRPARTHYRLLRRIDPLSLLELRLETGRTHQIRVHLAHMGFPVFGDPIYGGGRVFLPRLSSEERTLWSARLRRLNRQALHAYHLSLRHPRDGRQWVFEAPVPEDIESLLLEMIERPAAREET